MESCKRLEECTSHWENKYYELVKKLMEKEAEIVSLKRQIDEWKESACYWQSEYEDEHREFLNRDLTGNKNSWEFC